MFTIYCALYQEAQYLIQYYELKKESVSRHFQVFYNADKNIRLVITGVGKTNAAVAVAEISTLYPPMQEDIMINYGSCAGGEAIVAGIRDSDKISESESGISGGCVPLGSIIMVNKLTDVESGRTFYPDMIYNHPFVEGEVETSVHVYVAGANASDEASVRAEVIGQNMCDVDAVEPNMRDVESVEIESVGQNADGAGRLVHDMEAAAFYEAGNFYYGPHQMIFLKVVTDHGVTQVEQIARSVVDVIMQQSGETVVRFIDAVQTLLAEDLGNLCKPVDTLLRECQLGADDVPGSDEKEIRNVSCTMEKSAPDEPGNYVDEEQLAADLHCSVTMQAELTQLLRYWKLAGIDGKALIDTYYKKEQLPCKDKRAGRRILDELQNSWL